MFLKIGSVCPVSKYRVFICTLEVSPLFYWHGVSSQLKKKIWAHHYSTVLSVRGIPSVHPAHHPSTATSVNPKGFQTHLGSPGQMLKIRVYKLTLELLYHVAFDTVYITFSVLSPSLFPLHPQRWPFETQMPSF